jgi:hypothetical protein
MLNMAPTMVRRCSWDADDRVAGLHRPTTEALLSFLGRSWRWLRTQIAHSAIVRGSKVSRTPPPSYLVLVQERHGGT